MTNGRGGYTLLEVVLAIGIGLLLVAALYVAMDVQFRYMQSGRNAVAEAQVARGLLNRVVGDIRLSLGRLPTVAGGNQNAGGGATTGSETGQYNFGIVGDEHQITLFISAVPRFGRGEADAQVAYSDLRRVTYALTEEGLARQEVRLIANDSPDEEPPPDMLGPEVVGLRFSYYDATQGWLPTWDGTTSGPPVAVAVEMDIRPPSETEEFRTFYQPPTRYRRVVAIPAATPGSSTAPTQ